MKLIRLLGIVIPIFMVYSLHCQNVRWPYKLEGSDMMMGKPYKFGQGESAAYPGKNQLVASGVKGDKTKCLKYHFRPFDAKQLLVIENGAPGNITKIELGYIPDGEKKVQRKVISQNEIKPSEKNIEQHNIVFDEVKNVQCVWIYMDFEGFSGDNRIGAVALVNSSDPYTPCINLPEKKAFAEEITDMNDDVLEAFIGPLSPTQSILSIDNKYIYFTSEPFVDDSKRAKYTAYDASEELKAYEKVYRGTLNNDGIIKLTELSNYNLDDRISKQSSLVAISQDNNTMVINAMTRKELEVYSISTTKDKDGYTQYHKEKLKFKGFKNNAKYVNDIMSYDGNYYIVTMCKEECTDGCSRDMYIAIRKEGFEYYEFKHMGYDINTVGDEHPCYLAPDNKTLYFASDGFFGYGEMDIFVTRRLDDTWQRWSEPVNLGKPVNTAEYENYFTIGPKAEYAYFIRWGTDKDGYSDIFRIRLDSMPAQKHETAERTIKPEPVVIITGTVFNRKDNKPVEAEINYYDIDSMKYMGAARSNEKDGSYSIALPRGILYSYEAEARNYISVSENIDTKMLDKVTEITKDLYLVPVEKGTTIRLNNIFFETAKSTLKPESALELEKLLKLLNDNPKINIEISGHTDNVGGEDYNVNLSLERARAVTHWLQDKGVNPGRISAKGYGESKPVASNDTVEGRALNRRVEFTILKN